MCIPNILYFFYSFGNIEDARLKITAAEVIVLKKKSVRIFAKIQSTWVVLMPKNKTLLPILCLCHSYHAMFLKFVPTIVLSFLLCFSACSFHSLYWSCKFTANNPRDTISLKEYCAPWLTHNITQFSGFVSQHRMSISWWCMLYLSKGNLHYGLILLQLP